ncbi:TIR-like protein FxsC [Planomonospora corallina]|uniref:TIR-like protein FxsC n=1 Tax=Planomonospora corallina TaxID=1806052 RepID=A0ABV8I2K6_9ACTN
MAAPYSPGGYQGPCFFLSYAHVPSIDGVKGSDPNQWVERLFRALCDYILHHTDLPPDAVGYMDRELRTGENWPRALSEQLSTCRVFVPLYSPRYFESEACGKEWASFTGRAADHVAAGGVMPNAIVPALWTPVRLESMPQVAKDIQFNHTELGPHYADKGFYGIMKLKKYHHHYQNAVHELGRRIIEVAESTPMPRGDIPNFTEARNVFADSKPERPITVTVVAPDVATLPPGREPYHYGRTPVEWDPYRTDDGSRPLASRVAETARSRGFLPEVGTLDEHAEMLAGDEAQAPGVMLVDPWATIDHGCKQALQPVDRPGRPWVAVMVPWNRQDAQTVKYQDGLRTHLRKALANKLAEPESRPHIPTFDDFQEMLPDVLRRAEQRYLSRAPAYPPEGDRIDRPKLNRPEE